MLEKLMQNTFILHPSQHCFCNRTKPTSTEAKSSIRNELSEYYPSFLGVKKKKKRTIIKKAVLNLVGNIFQQLEI